jgi:serine/threonine-protein kinase HipA
MITTAYINIWNKRVGAIAWDANSGWASFEYEPSFLANQWDLSPLKMPVSGAEKQVFSFPELRNTTTFKGLPGLLADVLPDKYGSSLIKANNGATKIELSSLIRIAQEILSGRQQFNANLSADESKALSDILKIGASAGGARAKAVIAFNADTKEIRSGQADAPKGFTHWLLKFDGVTDQQIGTSSGYGRVEMAYYLMAKEAAIEMTECRLLDKNDRAHFMTKRFDREHGKGKIHVQSFCAIAHYDFNEINSFSYEQLFETMRSMLLPYTDAEQLYRRMVFNVMARNCDDHTKNFSFIMEKTGQWKLAPAFDVCHSYRPDSTWVSQHSMSINGKRQNITRNDLLQVAKKMNIKKADAIINQVHEAVGKWDEFAIQTKVKKDLKEAIAKTLLLL